MVAIELPEDSSSHCLFLAFGRGHHLGFGGGSGFGRDLAFARGDRGCDCLHLSVNRNVDRRRPALAVADHAVALEIMSRFWEAATKLISRTIAKYSTHAAFDLLLTGVAGSADSAHAHVAFAQIILPLPRRCTRISDIS